MLNNAEKVFVLEHEIGKTISQYCMCRNDMEALNIRVDIDSMLEELRGILNAVREEEEAFDKLFYEMEEASVE